MYHSDVNSVEYLVICDSLSIDLMYCLSRVNSQNQFPDLISFFTCMPSKSIDFSVPTKIEHSISI